MPENERMLALWSDRPGAANPPNGPTNDLADLIAAAVLGLVVEAQRRSLDIAVTVVSWSARPLAVVAYWAVRGVAVQRRNREAAIGAMRALTGAVAAAILNEVDLDGVVARIDIDRVVARIDVPALAEQVIDEVDLSALIRESSSTMASETVDALRVHGMHADGIVNRIVDRMLFRQEQRPRRPLAVQARP